MVRGSLLEQLIGQHEDRLVACLPAPAAENRTAIDMEKEESGGVDTAGEDPTNLVDAASEQVMESNDTDMEEEGSERLEPFCQELCAEFGYDYYTIDILTVSQRIRRSTTHHFGYKVLVAVSIFIASHLFDDPWSTKDLSEVIEVNDGSIRSLYTLVYPNLNNLIGSRILEKIGHLHPQRALQVMAPLSWPEL